MHGPFLLLNLSLHFVILLQMSPFAPPNFLVMMTMKASYSLHKSK